MAANISVEINQSNNIYSIQSSVLPQTKEQWLSAFENFCDRQVILDPQHRTLWLNSLDTYINNCDSLSLDTAIKAMEFSTLMCDWHLVLLIFNKRPSLATEKPRTFALAHWKIGNWETAYNCLERAMFAYPGNDELYTMYKDLLGFAQHQGFPRYTDNHIAPRISLEPLNYHHCNEFMWQYWDGDIPELCCLPQLRCDEDWHAWMADQEYFTDQTTFAVQHNKWGFVGVVSLVIHDHVGFFYYWIGKDFRRQGLGTEAVSLLLSFGKSCFGINCCYAKVFEHNTNSRNAMQKLGFTPLRFRAAAPNQSEFLYYWGEEKSDKESAQEAAILFAKMMSSTKVDMPLDWIMELGFGN